ncbi:MAG: hypothetical protein OEM63_04745 [Gammaproteobacteria bacterium]|nr:hypothetical protein [Gammaproteobacteria bacterium]
MTTVNYLFVALLLLSLSGCTKTEDDKESNDAPVMFPNYLIINAPSKDPDKQWYISDFFRRVEQWELETSINLNELKLGMYELTQYPNQAASQAHKDAAEKLVNDSFDAAVRYGWFSKEKGLSDGYESMYGDPVHFVNIEYVFDGETLNPAKPEVLMYYNTKEGDFLMGVMFLAIGQRGPQVAGPLSKWHYHIDRRMCYEQGVLPIGSKNDEGSCEAGFPNIRSPEMLHVWFFDHPEGKFATKMGLSEQTLDFGMKQVRELQKEHM